jgi:hypothetical protein
MALDKVKFNLRLPGDLYAKVAAAAVARVPQLSVNQELVRRINATFELEEDFGRGLDADVDIGEVLDHLSDSIARSVAKKAKATTKK